MLENLSEETPEVPAALEALEAVNLQLGSGVLELAPGDILGDGEARTLRRNPPANNPKFEMPMHVESMPNLFSVLLPPVNPLTEIDTTMRTDILPPLDNPITENFIT